MSESKYSRKIRRVLTKIGFEESNKITETLQGSIWRASMPNNKTGVIDTSVIKITNKYLHENAMTVVNNKIYPVKEDILLEQSILKYLTQQPNCPPSLPKFQRFFASNSAYFLVMEDAGSSLFDFFKTTHHLIRSKRVELSHWKEVCKLIFKQMIESIEFIHSKNVCHLDVSLENFVINDVHIQLREDEDTIKFVANDIQIAIVDFGLAKLFTRTKCLSNKYCGKEQYKSPEIVSKKKGFDAKANDIFCLGVCLWMMLTGSSLWRIASKSDKIFVHVLNGQLSYLVTEWKLLSYIDDDVINLLESIFKYEENRISLKEIKQHKWLK